MPFYQICLTVGLDTYIPVSALGLVVQKLIQMDMTNQA